jgi:hypothetical protein
LRFALAAGLAVTAAAGLAPAAGGAAAARSAGTAAPRLQLMVVGRSKVLRGPLDVVARARVVTASGHRCAVAAGTPLAALAALRTPSFAVRDFGACSARDPRASELLYVSRVAGDAARGSDGWVYKVGRRALGIGGANPRARVREGGRVLWFYCRMGARGCQRTLEVSGPARVTAGAPATFTVRAYDDRGSGVPAAGARLALAGRTATTAADGTATVPAPASAGTYRATADASGLVPSFPVEVRVG